jgi:hypothetical protein
MKAIFPFQIPGTNHYISIVGINMWVPPAGLTCIWLLSKDQGGKGLSQVEEAYQKYYPKIIKGGVKIYKIRPMVTVNGSIEGKATGV